MLRHNKGRALLQRHQHLVLARLLWNRQHPANEYDQLHDLLLWAAVDAAINTLLLNLLRAATVLLNMRHAKLLRS